MPGTYPPAAPLRFSLLPLQASLPDDGCHCKHTTGCPLAPTCSPLPPPGGATISFSAFGSSPLCSCAHAPHCGYDDWGVLPSAQRTLDSLPSGRGPAIYFRPGGSGNDGLGNAPSLAQMLGHHFRDEGGGGGAGVRVTDNTHTSASTGAASRDTHAPSTDTAAPAHDLRGAHGDASSQLPRALRDPGPLPNMLGVVAPLGSFPRPIPTRGPPVPQGSASAAMPPPRSRAPASAPASGHVPVSGGAPAREFDGRDECGERDERGESDQPYKPDTPNRREQFGSQAAAYDAGYAAGYAAAVQAMLDRGADAGAAFGGCEFGGGHTGCTERSLRAGRGR